MSRLETPWFFNFLHFLFFQLDILEHVFVNTQYPDSMVLEELADKLEISNDKVSVSKYMYTCTYLFQWSHWLRNLSTQWGSKYIYIYAKCNFCWFLLLCIYNVFGLGDVLLNTTFNNISVTGISMFFGGCFCQLNLYEKHNS